MDAPPTGQKPHVPFAGARTPPATYRDRALVYFDILGWKSLIGQSETDPALLGAFEEALSLVERARNDEDNGVRFCVSQFSDHFVISAPANAPSLAAISGFSSIAIARLLSWGLCARGAIVVGKLVHRPDCIYGPALVEAHEIESRIARYPRIVLSDAARALTADFATANVHTRIDNDGLTYLDVLSCLPGRGPEFWAALALIRERLGEKAGGPGEQKDLELRAKYGWLWNYIALTERESA